MSIEEKSFINVTGEMRSIYQQSSTGEKHVVFYPTTTFHTAKVAERKGCPGPSRRSGSQTMSSQVPRSSASHSTRMKKSEGTACDTSHSRGQSHPDPDTSDPKSNFSIGIYGWRKKCLYILILVLLIMVIVNLALTLWVLKVMEFSSEGMGQLKIVPGGLRLEGKAFVLDSLIASSIKSRLHQPIIFESSENLSLRARHEDGDLSSWMVLGNDKLECSTNNFRILDERGHLLFSVNNTDLTVGSETLHVTGEGGTRFSGSVQSTLVRAKTGHELRLESPTRTLEVKAAKTLHLESRGGKIETFVLSNISFHSEVGSINLETSSIVMPLLPTAKLSHKSSTSSKHRIYQLCVCESGKLFLAPPHVVCASENDDRLCR